MRTIRNTRVVPERPRARSVTPDIPAPDAAPTRRSSRTTPTPVQASEASGSSRADLRRGRRVDPQAAAAGPDTSAGSLAPRPAGLRSRPHNVPLTDAEADALSGAGLDSPRRHKGEADSLPGFFAACGLCGSSRPVGDAIRQAGDKPPSCPQSATGSAWAWRLRKTGDKSDSSRAIPNSSPGEASIAAGPKLLIDRSDRAIVPGIVP